MPRKFVEYSEGELAERGQEFISFLMEHRLQLDEWRRQGTWTDLVLNWFAATAREGVLCDTSASTDREQWNAHGADPRSIEHKIPARAGTGEFLKLDLVHSTYPSYDDGGYFSRAYWKNALKRSANEQGQTLQLLLALESEWKSSSDDPAYANAMHSASKLASVQARTKVLVFGSMSPTWRDELLDDLQRLRTAADPGGSWLVIDIPWQSRMRPCAWTPTKWQPRWRT